MILIPAIDLRHGRVVRLQQGDYARETRYAETALDQARLYRDAGAGLIHIVDLDSALDGGDGNLAPIGEICGALDIPVQTGGGVRGRHDVQARLDAGAARVVIGSVCVRDPQTVCDWIGSFGAERVVAGLDVKRDAGGRWMPQAAGWTESGEQDLFELLEHLTGAGLEHLLCTDIERDGMLTGAGVELYRELREHFPTLRIQASGGIGSEADIEAVAATGVHGCIVGRALLEGRVPMDAIGRFKQGNAP
ncbi:MAG: 1-(5-phosphoribosyl)-5-((5-phosphoribosylamino)methylideneamino)imidazole-4-carboxamide isomerase [Wenzhouxiangellaceae bacterium]|jgi:phosphoribosylformimino-5-aminoimidazole carboxamide ribotide isomerase|nr:1-(5-phosphoribosyl)-5-((5-phosphoribosylamino)methylideneamino)imidazole-4-carboxamide isomerase [Wenzhouxiangellaceae bacterium]MBS3747313.1 1-(5-phosphoribosyl)-5-((5-phosphoribosylamino)methylideneamino)imidazole-4-carboxamide isomerase [Wenzhouxiangellaceae bacterium]